jgi:hypothetical protein
LFSLAILPPALKQSLVNIINYYEIDQPAISGSRIAFRAQLTGDPALTFALYKFSNGKLEKQLDTNTPIPNVANEFFKANISAIAIQGEQIVFNSGAGVFRAPGGPFQNLPGGIYSVQNGVVKVIADTNTIAPGAAGQKFLGFAFGGSQFPSGVYDVSASDNQVIFAGYTSYTSPSAYS